MSDKLPCDLALVKCNSLTKSWIQKWLCYCPRVWTCIETEKTRTKLTLCDWNSFSLLSSVNISQLPERQDWCLLSEEFLADPVTHKHTDMTDYNTLRCSLARSVIKPKQMPVKHCANIVKNCFLPLSSNTPGKQTVCGLKYHLENCHKDIVHVESGIPSTRTINIIRWLLFSFSSENECLFSFLFRFRP